MESRPVWRFGSQLVTYIRDPIGSHRHFYEAMDDGESGTLYVCMYECMSVHCMMQASPVQQFTDVICAPDGKPFVRSFVWSAHTHAHPPSHRQGPSGSGNGWRGASPSRATLTFVLEAIRPGSQGSLGNWLWIGVIGGLQSVPRQIDQPHSQPFCLLHTSRRINETELLLPPSPPLRVSERPNACPRRTLRRYHEVARRRGRPRTCLPCSQPAQAR